MQISLPPSLVMVLVLSLHIWTVSPKVDQRRRQIPTDSYKGFQIRDNSELLSQEMMILSLSPIRLMHQRLMHA